MAKPGSAVAYIYIDYKDKERQTVTTILCSLLRQSLESMDAVPQEIQRIYDALPSDSKENTIDTNQCVSLFRKFVEEQSCRVFLLFDALDECSEMDHFSNEIRSGDICKDICCLSLTFEPGPVYTRLPVHEDSRHGLGYVVLPRSTERAAFAASQHSHFPPDACEAYGRYNMQEGRWNVSPSSASNGYAGE